MHYRDTYCSIAKDMRRITTLLSAALLDNSLVRVPHSLEDVKLFLMLSPSDFPFELLAAPLKIGEGQTFL
jgi:hypothetical protein